MFTGYNLDVCHWSDVSKNSIYWCIFVYSEVKQELFIYIVRKMYSCIAHNFTDLFSLKFYALLEVYHNMDSGIILSLPVLQTLIIACLLKCSTTAIVNYFSLLCICSYEDFFFERNSDTLVKMETTSSCHVTHASKLTVVCL